MAVRDRTGQDAESLDTFKRSLLKRSKKFPTNYPINLQTSLRHLKVLRKLFQKLAVSKDSYLRQSPCRSPQRTKCFWVKPDIYFPCALYFFISVSLFILNIFFIRIFDIRNRIFRTFIKFISERNIIARIEIIFNFSQGIHTFANTLI